MNVISPYKMSGKSVPILRRGGGGEEGGLQLLQKRSINLCNQSIAANTHPTE